MKKVLINTAVLCARFVNLFFKPLRIRDKVVIISRQADEPTLDIRMLNDELVNINIETAVLTKKLNKSIKGMISYMMHLISQMYHINTARVVVLDGYCILVSILPKKQEQAVVQIWHALGAVKKFGWQNIERPDGHSRDVAEAMKMHKNYDYVLAPSNTTGNIFAEAFRVPEDKIVLCGLPRIDFIRSFDEGAKEMVITAYPSIAEKTNVLYVPTFRRNSELSLEKLIAGFDFDEFNLIIKKHFLDKGDYSWAEKAGAIVDTRFSSLEWLRICEKIVTDYSAIAFEAAILDKDIYIYQPDADKYENNVGLNIILKEECISDYVCNTEEDLFEKLKEPYDRDSVIEFRKKYIGINTGDCTGQLCEFITGLMHK